MKKKEIKNIAARIAKAERTIATSTDSYEVELAKNEICKISGNIHSIEDMTAIDEMVQEILSENS